MELYQYYLIFVRRESQGTAQKQVLHLLTHIMHKPNWENFSSQHQTTEQGFLYTLDIPQDSQAPSGPLEPFETAPNTTETMPEYRGIEMSFL